MSSMNDKARILTWMAATGAVIVVFCLGIMAIGYKEPSLGRVFTTVIVAVCSIVCFALSRKLKNTPDDDTTSDNGDHGSIH